MNKEDCKRKIILEGVGGVLRPPENSHVEDFCCDTCCSSISIPNHERINVFKFNSISRKRRSAIRVVDKGALRTQLISVRNNTFKEKPNFSMVGLSLF